MAHAKKGLLTTLQEYSIPLIAGVIAAVAFANIDAEAYAHFVHWNPIQWFLDLFGGGHEAAAHGAAVADSHGSHGFSLFGRATTVHFLFNDIFMVFFFGIAAVEITMSASPGGDLNPPSKAINPLFGTIGGVVGPVVVYHLLTHLVFDGTPDYNTVAGGWGIPTATDIALAWLVARVVFGAKHPAVNFLLLLAIADDAIGLGIIAIFYPDPNFPAQPQWLLLVALGVAIAFGLRKAKVQSWVPYIVIAGTLSWIGLISAALHPALALVPIVPFLPGRKIDDSSFASLDALEAAETHDPSHGSPLEQFEHAIKAPVDFGLFFFGLSNAGVEFAEINSVTWIVFGSLLIGKTIGITGFAFLGNLLGFKYPAGMHLNHVVTAGIIAGMGLTVALFVAGQAFTPDSGFQGPAKMGALFSAGAAVVAIAFGKLVRAKEFHT